MNPDAVIERGEGEWSLHNRTPASELNGNRDDGVHGGGNGGFLWSCATACEITALITEDIAAGRTDRAHGDDLIGRVWARAGPR